jgi:hypothetical protein
MKNISSLLSAASFGVTFAAIFTCIVILAFVVMIVLLWWVDIKKKPINALFKAMKKGIFNAFDKVNDFFTAGSTVKTIYQDKTLNYSGTEFLPVPTKAPTDKYTYEFVGWDKNGVDQNGNFVVRAIYLQRVIKCYVNVFDDDKATLLKSLVVEYGAGANLSELNPKKPETKEFSYEFVGWDKDITAFYGNTNVCAVYKAIPKKYSYTFFDEDGQTIVSQGTALYGTPIISPSAPQKESTDKVVYEFAGWKNYNEGMLLTKDYSFVAMFEKRAIDKEVASSVIKADGTVVRSAKPEQKQTAPLYSEIKKVNATEPKEEDFLHGSVGAQIASNLKKEHSAQETVEPKQTTQSTIQSSAIVLTPNEKNDEIHQKIQLVSNKDAMKIDNQPKEDEKSDDDVFNNMVVNVNRVRIKKK